MQTYYKVPGFAYFDSFAGLVPCKVISIDAAGALTIKITANRKGHHRGEVFTWRQREVVPRDRIRRRKYSTWVTPGYVWYKPHRFIKLPNPDRPRGTFGAVCSYCGEGIMHETHA